MTKYMLDCYVASYNCNFGGWTYKDKTYNDIVIVKRYLKYDDRSFQIKGYSYAPIKWGNIDKILKNDTFRGKKLVTSDRDIIENYNLSEEEFRTIGDIL